MNTTEQEPREPQCPNCTLPSAMCACPDAPGWSEDGCMVVHCPDPIIAANIREMAGRSVVGIGKYQKMLTRTDLSPKEWFTHHRTELMDAMGYNRKLEGIYDDLQQTIKELAEDNSRKADRIAELETQRAETMADYRRQAERIAELEAENGRLRTVARWAQPRGETPHYCPKCSNPLQRVRQSVNSMLNAEQFDAIRSGDWFCDCGGPDTDGYRYFWQSELPAPPKGEEGK